MDIVMRRQELVRRIEKVLYDAAWLRTAYAELMVYSDSEGFVPVSAEGYQRQFALMKKAEDDGHINDNAISFPTAPSGWGTVEGVAIVDEEGRTLMFGLLTTPVTIGVGDKIMFREGDLRITWRIDEDQERRVPLHDAEAGLSAGAVRDVRDVQNVRGVEFLPRRRRESVRPIRLERESALGRELRSVPDLADRRAQRGGHADPRPGIDEGHAGFGH